MEIITRTEAKKKGLKYFFTGIPCKHGHVSKRCINTYVCYQCKLNAYHKYYTKNRKRLLTASNKWTEKNPERVLFLSAKNRAKKKNIVFSLTMDDIIIPKICPILRIPLVVGVHSDQPDDYAPSIDRIDSTLGYVKDNIIVISFRANRIKGGASIEELEKLLTFYEQVSK